ncbi:hypothetical protein AB0D30_31285 [Streptomyces sp. NPDC048409]|uniref:hypothetical protein n=1 Tax=Streptomyces sp. NPDC048409 TaxID=3154723 RepID=UPI003428971C
MKRRTSRVLTLAVATATLSAAATVAAFAETPQYCDGLVCLKDGTRFGAPAEAFPAQSEPGAVSATQIVEDCAAAQVSSQSFSCGFYPYSDPQTVGYGPWKRLTSDYVNCYGGNNQNNLNWSSSSTYTTTNSVTVSSSVEVGLSELFKATFSAQYARTWGTAEGETQSFSSYVPRGKKAHLQHRYQKQQASGVLWIDYGETGNQPGQGYGHHYYAITDFTATSPVKNEDEHVDDQVSMSSPKAAQSDDCS